nr:MucBP domain-containing protein [Lachnospiraceae bacterium]
MTKRIRKLTVFLATAIVAALAFNCSSDSAKAGPQVNTVLQAVQEADSGCNVNPPTITSFTCSEEANAAGIWTYTGSFTAVAGVEAYELHLGTMEGNGSVYERSLITLPKNATNFTVSPDWYDHLPVAGETVYAALEAIVKVGTGSDADYVSTGWQKLSETTTGPAPAADKNKLTVRFVNQNQMSISPAHIAFLDQGDSYSVDVPEVAGYDCKYASNKVTGTMGNQDVTINVPYDGKTVQLSIVYLYNSDQSQASDPVNATYKVGDSYKYPSPVIQNYKADPETVEGYVTADDVPKIEKMVLYKKDKFILETRYVLWDGDNNIENDEEIKERETQYVEAGTTYSVAHPKISPYMRADDQGSVILDTQENENLKKEGVMPEARHVVRLYYLIEKSNLTISFVRDDDNSQVAVGFTGEWRRDKDFTWEAPIDQVKGYQLI